jgi:hypothetical protein
MCSEEAPDAGTTEFPECSIEGAVQDTSNILPSNGGKIHINVVLQQPIG